MARPKTRIRDALLVAVCLVSVYQSYALYREKHAQQDTFKLGIQVGLGIAQGFMDNAKAQLRARCAGEKA